MALRLVARKVHPLSRRQVECLELYADGMSYRDIAGKLGLAYDTVKRHMEELRSKLNVSSSADAYRELRRMSRDSR